MKSRSLAALSGTAFALIWACGGVVTAGNGGSSRTPDASTESGSDGGAQPDAATVPPSPVVVSTTTRTPRVTTLGANYWTWMPTLGDPLAGTDTLMRAIGPAVLRVGGYNNDANTPDAFDDAALDQAVAYARTIGAAPVIQVPILAYTDGTPATAAEAAAMVQYANVTRKYAVPYFSIGNEPDLYATQGLPTDMTQPAIPGFSPADYCATAKAYVAAMKAVDGAIKIVGPDLAYKYIAGGGANDWLTPILEQCGGLFDVVSIHRYPFEAMQATLEAARADPAVFRGIVASVRSLMKAAGYGAKPLALTEMNVVYDATTCFLGASPGTVGSGLWMADSLGVAYESGLWTSAVWDISDPDSWGLGLIGLPPAHTPRPEYWAYEFYAQSFGDTLLDVTSAPAGVSAHASRDRGDDATEIIVVNWNESAQNLVFRVTGLATPPDAPAFVMPAVSMASVTIPDVGAATAAIYGEAERQLAEAPLPPASQRPPIPDAGLDSGAGAAVGAGCSDAAATCTGVVLPSAAVTTMGTASGAVLTYGTSADSWVSYTFAATGQALPTGTVTPDGTGIAISGGITGPVKASNDYAGLGLYYSSTSCVDASAYTGVKFDFSGTLGGCSLAFGASFSADLSHLNGTRGACTGTNATCYGPEVNVVPAATISVPFTSLTGGMPIGTLDPGTIVSVQWQLASPVSGDGGGCAAAFTVENVAFY